MHDPFLNEVGRKILNLQAEKILDLGRKNQQGDAARKTNGQRVGDELQECAKSCQPHDDQECSRHQGSDSQPVVSLVPDDVIDYDNERPRGAGNLDTTPAKGRYDNSRDDGSIETLLGFYP
jgi:hypothetical protein